MATSVAYAERCAELKRWLFQHHGILPKQKSDDNAEASLANWLSKTLPRRFRALGSKANQRQLTPAELSQLDDAMGSAIIAERDDLAAKLKVAQGERDDLAAKLNVAQGELAVKEARLKMKDEELTIKDIVIKDLKRKIAELQPPGTEIQNARDASEAAAAASDAVETDSSIAASVRGVQRKLSTALSDLKALTADNEALSRERGCPAYKSGLDANSDRFTSLGHDARLARVLQACKKLETDNEELRRRSAELAVRSGLVAVSPKFRLSN